MGELEDLDGRLMAFADQLGGEDGENLRHALTSVREVWRGADRWPSLAEDAQVLAENAQTIAAILTKRAGV
ncbi:hypothetical protein [Amycolatopsis sp. NPDC003731]